MLSFNFRAVDQNRQTRILATLGPATDSVEAIGKLLDAGANIFRLNMSHARHDWAKTTTAHIREAAAQRGRVPAVLMDLQGPAIRTGDLPEPLELKQGDRFDFTVDATVKGDRVVGVNYPNFLNDIEVGAIILIDNGLIRMKVLNKTESVAECEVDIGGTMGKSSSHQFARHQGEFAGVNRKRPPRRRAWLGIGR